VPTIYKAPTSSPFLRPKVGELLSNGDGSTRISNRPGSFKVRCYTRSIQFSNGFNLFPRQPCFHRLSKSPSGSFSSRRVQASSAQYQYQTFWSAEIRTPWEPGPAAARPLDRVATQERSTGGRTPRGQGSGAEPSKRVRSRGRRGKKKEKAQYRTDCGVVDGIGGSKESERTNN
jgi:hypothetical protein